MSYAKKTNCYRGITVEGTRYRWCFRSDARDTTVTIQGGESGGQQAVAIIRGRPDFWLAFPTTRKIAITPKSVRQMILQALAHGWQPSRRAASVTFDYEPTDSGR